MSSTPACIADIPELRALESRTNLMRIPQEVDVPLTSRVRSIVDAPEFRRLSRISQLGLVAQVYPAAHHSRFEHSLGVYRMALLYLQRMQHHDAFAQAVPPKQAEVFLLAALLHDIGHWPYCHPIEDLGLADVPSHEVFATEFLLNGEIADVIRNEWDVDPGQVVELLSGKSDAIGTSILRSMLSGPIDIDKMDYLMRDSLHAGVPYGRNFDQQRLIGSLCLNEAGNGIALTAKGKTAAEMMVFSRYVMFSEVYWHHAVRAATAMLQRAFYRLHDQWELNSLFRLTEQPFIDTLREQAKDTAVNDLVDGLFGDRRRLYKRWVQLNLLQNADDYAKLARMPYNWLLACSSEVANALTEKTGSKVTADQVLIDAPPSKLEVQFQVDVFYSKESRYRRLDEVSPVVQTLATRQFDDYVKSVRVFLHPDVRQRVGELEAVDVLRVSIDRV